MAKELWDSDQGISLNTTWESNSNFFPQQYMEFSADSPYFLTVENTLLEAIELAEAQIVPSVDVVETWKTVLANINKEQ